MQRIRLPASRADGRGAELMYIVTCSRSLLVELRSVAHDLDIGVIGDEDGVIFHLGAVIERIDRVEQDGAGVECLDLRQVVSLSDELVERAGYSRLLRLAARGGGVSGYDAMTG